MKRMTHILSTLIFFFLWKVSLAQPGVYDDLQILFADANYEKLVKSAESYTMKEDLKKDPIPFIYLSKGLYKISLSGTADEKFKNAYKDAIGALSKALKIAKDSIELLNDHIEFIGQFQASMVETISNDLSAKDYNKASGWVLKYYKITSNPIGAKYIDGATKYRKADKGGANVLWKEAETMLKGITTIDDWSAADQTLLKLGVIETAECYVASKQVEKAKETMNKVAQWFENDTEFKEKYDSLVN
jgi:hypothetical protein